MKKNNNHEVNEALMRIPVLIVSGIILSVWGYLIGLLIIVNFFYTIFSSKRMKEVALLSEVWNTQVYSFMRYMTFVENKRPFPFSHLEKNISKFK
jgi:hypothetical protein